MEATRMKYLKLLKYAIELVQLQELFERAGEHDESRSIKAELDSIRPELESLKSRLALKVVKAS